MSIQNNSNRITTNLALIQNLQLEVDNIIAVIGDADLEQVLTNGNSAGSSDIDMSGNDILQVDTIQFQDDIVLRGAKVAIGNSAGETNQGSNAVAIGNFSGRTNQTNNAVAIGINAGNTGQSDSGIGIGNLAGENTQGQRSVAIGRVAGRNTQGTLSVAVGPSCGSTSQGQRAVAIGNESGETNQSNNSIAIGERAGRTSLGLEGIAIGRNSGTNSQQRTINIGENAGSNASQEYSISVGVIAGQNNQGSNAIAIGRVAGQTNQGTNAIAIGYLSGLTGQGSSSIAIGTRAGQANQEANTIVLNATGATLNTDVSGAFFVAPVREKSGNYVLQYDTSNNEVSYSNTIDVSGELKLISDTISMVVNDGNCRIDSQTSRMEFILGENFDGSALSLVADPSGCEISSNNKLTIQADGDLILKNQDGGGDKISIESDSGIEMKANGDIDITCINSTGAGAVNITAGGSNDGTNVITLNAPYGNIDLTSGDNIRLDALYNNIDLSGATNINLNTENLNFNGTGLQSDSAGGNSGEHLVITLNGVQYKIKLELP